MPEIKDGIALDSELVDFVVKAQQGSNVQHKLNSQSNSATLDREKLHVAYFQEPGEYSILIPNGRPNIPVPFQITRPHAVLFVKFEELWFDKEAEDLCPAVLCFYRPGDRDSYDAALRILRHDPKAADIDGVLEAAARLKKKRDGAEEAPYVQHIFNADQRM